MSGSPVQRALAVQRSEFAKAALEHFPVTDPHLEHVTDSFNTIFRVRAVEGDFTLRVNDGPVIHSVLGPQVEEAWTTDLAAAGIAVPQTIRTRSGSLVVTSDALQSYRASLLTWMPGEALPRPVDAPRIGAIGELSARMHLASQPRPWHPAGSLDARRLTLFDIPDVLHTAPRPYRSVLLIAASRTRTWLREFWCSIDESPRLLHFDLTPNNLVMRPDRSLAAIDCEDLAWGHRHQDIANTLYGITRGVVDEHALVAFRDGYQRHAAWPKISTQDLEQLFTVRRLTMTNLALTLRRPGLLEYVARHVRAISGTPALSSTLAT